MTDKTDFEHNLQRLVDGELESTQYRRLLQTMEESPDRWRRCALAFLEDQALRQTLNDDTFPLSGILPGEEDSERVQFRPPSRRMRSVTSLGLAMAASFLLAFTLGIAARTWFAPAPSLTAEQETLAGAVAEPGEDVEPADTAPRPALADQPVGTVTVFVDEGRQLELPVYEYSDEMARLIESDRTLFPPSLLRMLREQGHDVRRVQRLLPVDTEGGQQVILPVEELQIVPVRDYGYQ